MIITKEKAQKMINNDGAWIEGTTVFDPKEPNAFRGNAPNEQEFNILINPVTQGIYHYLVN